MTKEAFLEQYKDYLKSNALASYENYATYLRNTCRDLSLIRDHLSLIAECGSKKTQVQYAEQMLLVVELSRKDPTCCVKAKALGNYSAAIKKLICFLTGDDPNTKWVKYEKDVRPEEKIADLCRFFEDEYEKLLGFARKLFGGMFNLFPKIPVYLSKERPSKLYTYNEESLAKVICACCEHHRNRRDETREPCGTCESCIACERKCEIQKILERHKPFEEKTLGRFYPGTKPCIVIYYRNYEGGNDKGFYAKLAKTFAHEYMHYLHYAFCTARGVAEPLVNEKLNEALADFFGVYYSAERGSVEDIETAQSRYQQWQKRADSLWPYACARYFLPKPYKPHISDYALSVCDSKLQKILSLTPNPDAAFDALVL